jgi:hypothetical protein
MKGKQLAIVLVLLVALGGAALLLNRRHEATWSSSASAAGGKILEFPLNDVSRVTIKGSGAEVNLVKKEDVWSVQERADYPANFEKVSTLIRKLWELRPVQDVKIGPSQFARLQLDEPRGTLIDLKGGDKRLAALLLGKTQMRNADQSLGATGGMPAGRYAMAQDGFNRVFLLSETLDDVQPKPEQWLNRDFVKIESPKLITLAGSTPGMHWTLTRENATAPWKLADAKPGEEFDPAKATSAGTLFMSAVLNDVLPPDAPPNETGLDQPTTAHFETFDNFVYDLRIGKLSGDNYPVLVSVNAELAKERTPPPDEKPEDKARLDQEFQNRQKQLAEKLEKEKKLGSRPFLMGKSTIDQLVKDRSALMAEKKPSPSLAPASTPAASPPPASKASAPPRKK